jgi:hypothetical protein
MNHQKQKSNDDLGLTALDSLPVIPAKEFIDWGRETTASDSVSKAPAENLRTDLFESEAEYRLCRTIVEQPMQPSSFYPKQARVSSKTAIPLRENLVVRGYIREHSVVLNNRRQTTILLEPLPAGIAAVAQSIPDGKE